MSSYFKMFSLTVVAGCALCCVAAMAAQAATHHFTVATAPAVITARDTVNTVFSTTGGESKIECTTTKYEGTLSGTTNTQITVTPTYSECNVLVFGSKIPATVDVNHCAYVLGTETNANGDAMGELECGAENTITITYSVFGSSCIIHVAPGGGGGTGYGMHFTQNGEKVKGQATFSGIPYYETGNGFCPATHTGEDGTLNGTVEAEAFKDSGSSQSGTEKTTPTFSEGAGQKLTLNESVT